MGRPFIDFFVTEIAAATQPSDIPLMETLRRNRTGYFMIWSEVDGCVKMDGSSKHEFSAYKMTRIVAPAGRVLHIYAEGRKVTQITTPTHCIDVRITGGECLLMHFN